MEIVYSTTAKKNLHRLSKKDQIKVLRNVRRIAAEPRAGKKLKGSLGGLWSKRAWPYRIIYQFSGKILIVVAIRHRQKAYQ
jgi:mRNA-degrading endonuclease RelE of RelBE toxin-antitoxin system